jgi:hypothetical protein
MWELTSGPYPETQKICDYLDNPFYSQKSCEIYLKEVEVNILSGKNYYFPENLDYIDKLRCKNREMLKKTRSSDLRVGDFPEMMIDI